MIRTLATLTLTAMLAIAAPTIGVAHASAGPATDVAPVEIDLAPTLVAVRAA